MALVCLKVWGLNFLVCREMHVVVAVVARRLTRCSMASRLSRFPVRVGNSGSVGLPFRSVIHTEVFQTLRDRMALDSPNILGWFL